MPTLRIRIGCPSEFAESIIKMFHEHPPVLPDGRVPSVRNVPPRGDAIEFDLIYPEPPSIPELIAKWHAEPTRDNRKALLAALTEHRTAYFYGETCYFAGNRNGVRVIEVY